MIHAWSGVAMIVAAVIHFAIHWRWVTKVTRNVFGSLRPQPAQAGGTAEGHMGAWGRFRDKTERCNRQPTKERTGNYVEKKIVMGALLTGLVGVLAWGGVNRTNAKSGEGAAAERQSTRRPMLPDKATTGEGAP